MGDEGLKGDLMNVGMSVFLDIPLREYYDTFMGSHIDNADILAGLPSQEETFEESVHRMTESLSNSLGISIPVAFRKRSECSRSWVGMWLV